MKPNQKGKKYTDFKKEMKRNNELLNKPVYNHPSDYPKDLMKSFQQAKQEEKKDTIYGSQSNPEKEAQVKRQKKIDKLSSNPKLWKHLEHKGII